MNSCTAGSSWQVGGVVDEVKKGDEGVGFAAAVGQFELAHGFVVFACQAGDDIAGQFAQVVGGVGEGEEVGRVFVDRARAFLGCDIVQVGGEGGQ
jgi:hypothetical protein